MHHTSVENDVQTIVAAETASPQITSLDSSKRLAEVGFNVGQFLTRLGLQAEEAGVLDQITVGELITLIESKPADVREKLWELATTGRIRRLLQGILLATLAQPPVDEERRWWYELATQILWRYARQDSDKGLQLVKRGIPARATQSLAGLGLLEIDLLSKDDTSNAATFIDVLERLKYPVDVATNAYKAMVDVSKKVSELYDGKLQRALRRHGNQMVDAIGRELLPDSEDMSFLTEAVRSWISTTTSLPINVWSPSTNEFVKKFAEVGVSGEMLIQVAEDLGVSLSMADISLAQFMEGICRNCDPGDEEHQYCVKRFAMSNWQVECPARPDLAPLSL